MCVTLARLTRLRFFPVVAELAIARLHNSSIVLANKCAQTEVRGACLRHDVCATTEHGPTSDRRPATRATFAATLAATLHSPPLALGPTPPPDRRPVPCAPVRRDALPRFAAHRVPLWPTVAAQELARAARRRAAVAGRSCFMAARGSAACGLAHDGARRVGWQPAAADAVSEHEPGGGPGRLVDAAGDVHVAGEQPCLRAVSSCVAAPRPPSPAFVGS